MDENDLVDRLAAGDEDGTGQPVEVTAGHQAHGTVLRGSSAILTAGPRGDNPRGGKRPHKKQNARSLSAPGALGGSVGRALDFDDVCSAGSLRAVDDFEPHLVTFVESAESLGPDLRVVDE